MIPVQSHFVVPSHLHGLRVDQYLQRIIGRISRARAQRIIRSSDFLLDGFRVKVSQRVKYGQKATLIRLAPDSPADITGLQIPVIYEDDEILVLNKPAGLSIHPSANCLFKTLTYWLRINRPGQKINPCHRIDKETSGVVICAKKRNVESMIKKLFMTNKIKKSYIAISTGFLKAQVINLSLALQQERGLVAIRMIPDPEGKEALTKVRPLYYDSILDRTLVMCRPKTGRQHQIRAHLEAIGHPIIGDKLYYHGDQFFDDLCRRVLHKEKELSHHRHALHARSLKFNLKGRRHAYSSAIPADFFELMKI